VQPDVTPSTDFECNSASDRTPGVPMCALWCMWIA